MTILMVEVTINILVTHQLSQDMPVTDRKLVLLPPEEQVLLEEEKLSKKRRHDIEFYICFHKTPTKIIKMRAANIMLIEKKCQ